MPTPVTVTTKVEGTLPSAAALRGGLRTGLRRGLNAIRRQARALAPRGRTGQLRRSLRVLVRTRGETVIGQVGVGRRAFYGRFLERGAAPHEILPLRRTVLVFEAGGHTIFARKVRHPGVGARPFLGPAARQELPTLQREVEAALRAVLTPAAPSPSGG